MTDPLLDQHLLREAVAYVLNRPNNFKAWAQALATATASQDEPDAYMVTACVLVTSGAVHPDGMRIVNDEALARAEVYLSERDYVSRPTDDVS